MLYGMSRADAVRRGQQLFDELQLEGLWTRMPKNMSGGQKRRLDIAMGLIHDPTLVFLDEPTTGLDPQARANLWEHIARLRTERGATVFLTTHYLDEADALSDRIVIIDRGRIVASDTSDNLKAQVAGRPGRPRGRLRRPGHPGGRAAARPRPATSTCRRPPRPRPGGARRARRPGLLRDLEAGGVSLDSIEVHRPTLDDVFLTLTGRSLRDAEAEDGADETEPLSRRHPHESTA